MLLEVMSEAEKNSLIGPESRLMMEGVLRISEMRALDIMVAGPRIDMIDIEMERDELFRLAEGLDAAKTWADAAAVMEEAIGQYPFGTDGMRIRLATILAGRLDRPQEALDLLDGLDPEMLSAEQGTLAERVSRKAREMIAKRPPAP